MLPMEIVNPSYRNSKVYLVLDTPWGLEFVTDPDGVYQYLALDGQYYNIPTDNLWFAVPTLYLWR